MSDASDFEGDEGGEEPPMESGEEGDAPQDEDEDVEKEEGEDEGEGVQVEDQQEEEEKLPEHPLTEEMLGDCLSLLCKTGNGLAHAYVRLDIHEREITDISILKSFIHLRYVDVSANLLRDVSALNSLTHLLTLKADRNLLKTAALDELPYLQMASFTNNKINTTEGINHPLLETLVLSYNEIKIASGLDPGKLRNLHTLELRGNRLESTNGIYLPNLKNLFLGANMIKRVEGLERLEKLTTLHLRDNQIDTLDGFAESMKSLQYINLRGNNMTSVKEVKKLTVLPMLRALVFLECPVTEEDDYRIEVLIALRRIERLDKDEYTEDERQEAEEIYEQRRQEEQPPEGAEEVIEDQDDADAD
ncbi:leucine-rich repeat-containing protein 23-like [Branchiostoma floridae]|uniref:Leucine-rich repeat-containing protein 23 n=1 Tax=Branchiostoma floridae TaxID=7739 RepID=A0A9J7MBI5_BRAFL|nr:leucine-rich repeat-containing protein 23-like [Branchiostoma floridae]